MYQSIVYVKLKLIVQATQIIHTVFIQIPLHIQCKKSHEPVLLEYICAQIKAGSTNGRKQVAWNDVKSISFP